MRQDRPRRQAAILTPAVLLFLAASALASGESADRPRTDKPVVTVLAPPGLAYLLQPSEGEKIVVVLEITDATRQGIKTDDAGEPEFVAPDVNVEAFSRNVTETNSYVDRLGHPVLEITARIPVKDLKQSETGGISPPTDIYRIPPEVQGKSFNLPMEALAPVAKFRFVVEDRAGTRSDPQSERCVLYIGFPHEVFVPTTPAADEGQPGGTKKPGQSPKPRGEASAKPPAEKPHP